jgi:hypothetical protein
VELDQHREGECAEESWAHDRAGLDAFAKRTASEIAPLLVRAASRDAGSGDRKARQEEQGCVGRTSTRSRRATRSYAAWWITTAKKDETKAKRIAKLIEFSEKGKRL